MSNNSSPLPSDQEVVFLVSEYINATNIVNTTFQNGDLSNQFTYIGNASTPFDWLAHPSIYEEQNVSSNFCDNGNCVKDCQDVNQMFNGISPAPFGVCLLFPNVSRSLPNRDIWTEQQASLLSSFLSSADPEGSFETTASVITSCFNNACGQNPNAKHCAQSCSSESLSINISTLSFSGVSDCLQQVCSQDLMFADFDLAGIGVTISYFMQIIIAIVAISYLLLLQKRFKKICLHSQHHRSREDRQSREDHQSREDCQSREDRRDEFISSLVEFHKAQCFFVIAVQIAALTLMQKPDQTSQANMTAIPVTAAIGIQAPLFAYLAIAKYGRQSSYLLLLTAAAWLLSSMTMWDAYVILYVAGNVSYQLPSLPQCGNHDLSFFCYSLGIYTRLSSDSTVLNRNLAIWFKVWIAVWSVSVLVLFSVVASWIQLTDFPKLRRLKAFLGLSSRRLPNAKMKRLKWSKPWRYLDPETEKDAWLFYLLTALLAASLCMEIYQLAYLWKLNLESVSNWTFGQIVAVLAWAAPLAEFLNITINGFVEGSNFRFARSLTVTRVHQSLPVSQLKPVHQQRQSSDGESAMQLIDSYDDDATSARRWSYRTVQEIANYDLNRGIGGLEP